MKRVLIIVYYWPPTGGSGVQRWVKFVKHLRSCGWEPVIYTPLNPNVPERDETLLKDIPEGIEVLKQPVFEVTRFFGAHNPTAGTNKNSLLAALKKRVGNFIRANFFIPDPRVIWVRPSVKFLSNYLKAKPVNVIVSSGPPHSMHLIAKALATELKIPWLADFRDPWLEMINFHGFKPSATAYKKNVSLFKSVITTATGIITAHPGVAEKFKTQTSVKVSLITNGYDASDFENIQPVELDKSKFHIVFVGVFYGIRNIPVFWEALNELTNENLDFRYKLSLSFVGSVHAEVMDSLLEHQLISYCNFKGYLEHSTAIGYEMAANALLLSTPMQEEFRYEIPAKIFEYLAVQKPVICIADVRNDAAQILLKAKAGYVIHPTDKKEMKEVMMELFSSYGNQKQKAPGETFNVYERKNLTAQLATELYRVSS